MSGPKGGYLEVAPNSILQRELCSQPLKVIDPHGKYNLKVPQVSSSSHAHEAFTTVPDDGLGYDEGVRVLRSIGSWASEYSPGSSSSYPQQDMAFDDTKEKSMQPPQTNSMQNFQMTDQKMKPKIESTNKSFTCPECGKGLARKDKLVIHMRIHTGEKPYVCEVCKKAFSRRDKLVIHMNRLKHLTPANLAPLSKRLPDSRPLLPPQRKEMKDESTSPPPQGALRSPDEWTPPVQIKDITFYGGAAPYPPPDQSYCLMCHQSFSNRDQFMIHLRTHFLAPPTDTTQVCS